MPACLIFDFARTSRWPIVAGETRKADAIAAASKPRMVCSISGARMAGSIAGWAQANIRPRRSSGIAVSSIASSNSSASRRRWSAASPRVRRRRAASISRRRATAISHASGLRGMPEAGQSASAAANASASASSAAATSPVRAARKATSFP